jgi:hypothetical protein
VPPQAPRSLRLRGPRPGSLVNKSVPAPAASRNTVSTGHTTRFVTVKSISADGQTAVCVDRSQVEVRVPMTWQRAKGALPAVGEYWVISQDVTNSWTFALCMSTPATAPVANGHGFFWYSGGVAAPGALVMSAAAAGGSDDGAGNAYVAGFALYISVHQALALDGGSLFAYSAPGYAGPWTPGSASIQFGGGLLAFLTTAGASTVVRAFESLITVGSSGEVPSTWQFNLPLEATDGQSVTGGLDADVITSTGGTATDPTIISTDTWHDLRPLNTGFTGTLAGYYPPQYRLTPDRRVEIFGAVGLPGLGYNSATIATLPGAYTPNNSVYMLAGQFNNTGSAPGNGASITLSVDTSGNLQFHNIPSGAPPGPMLIDVSFPLDASGLIQS